MRSILTSLAILIVSCATAEAQQTIPPSWVKATEYYVNVGPPRQYLGPVQATNCWYTTSCGSKGPLPGQWQIVDLTVAPWLLAADAKAAMLSGVLIITHGTTAETADLQVVFRPPGDVRVSCDGANLIGQAMETAVGNGQRSNMSTWVPLVDGRLEYCWRTSTPGTWPNNSSYAVNLSVQAWVR